MAYEVLSLKYRPKVFEDLIGQEPVTRTLMSAIQQDRIAHAFLFSGVRGVGKTTTARILAKALNCHRGPTVRPCGECPGCTEIARGSSLDVLEIDGASNNGVEQVRELVEGSRYAPSRDRFKIYIIDEVHMLSMPAFNALLKTLEEPPPAVKFIFATTEHHKIPDTILSRCQEFEFRTVAPAEISTQLQMIAKAENIDISATALSSLSRAAAGSLRDGISALDQVIAATTGTTIEEQDVTELLGLIERDVLRQTTRALIEQDTAAILTLVDGLSRGGRDFRYFTTAMMHYLRDILVAKVAPGASELMELPDETSELEAFAGEFSEEDLLRALEVLTEAESALRSSPEPRFHLEMALLKLSQLHRLASFEELLARFEAFISGAPPSPTSGSAPKTVSRPALESTASRAREPSPGGETREARGVPEASARSTDAAPDDWTSDVPPLGEAGASELDFGARLVQHLKASKPMLHALVSHSETATLAGTRLTLTYAGSQKALAEQLQQKALKELLEEQASVLVGRKLHANIHIVRDATEADLSPPEPQSDDTASAGLRDRAQRDPLVRQFIDAFQGEIESVQEPDR